MTRSRILAVLGGIGLSALAATSASAQTSPPRVIVPAPSASPSTVVTPSPSGTTVVAPPGSTVVVQPPARTTAVAVPVAPWCGGAYASPGGTNFGGCPGYLPR
jgi:hypothetical protein